MIVYGLAQQGSSYAQDLGNHGWNPASTAGDAWGRYSNAFASGDYYDAGRMTGDTVIAVGGDLLLGYGAYKGMTAGGASDTAAATSAGDPDLVNLASDARTMRISPKWPAQFTLKWPPCFAGFGPPPRRPRQRPTQSVSSSPDPHLLSVSA
jgi:hypothetical protein